MERNTRQIELGGIKIGGGAPITVQSMTKTDTRDIPGTVAQIKSLEKAGCDIVRLAVPDMDAAKSLGEIKKNKLIFPLYPTFILTTNLRSKRLSKEWTV